VIKLKYLLIPLTVSVISWFLAGSMDLTRAEQQLSWPVAYSFVGSKYVLNKCRLMQIAVAESSVEGILNISFDYSSFSEDWAKSCVESTVRSVNIDIESYRVNIDKKLNSLKKNDLILAIDENLSGLTLRQLFETFQEYQEYKATKNVIKHLNSSVGQTNSQLKLVKVPLPRLRISLLGFLLATIVLIWLRGSVGVARPH